MERNPQYSVLWQGANNRTDLLYAYTPLMFFRPFQVPPVIGMIFMPQMAIFRNFFPLL